MLVTISDRITSESAILYLKYMKIQGFQSGLGPQFTTMIGLKC